MSVQAALQYEQYMDEVLKMIQPQVITSIITTTGTSSDPIQSIQIPTRWYDAEGNEISPHPQIQWTPIQTDKDRQFQELMQRMQHRVHESMGVPPEMLGAERPSTATEQMMRQLQLQQEQKISTETILKLMGFAVDNEDLNELLRQAGKGPEKVEEPEEKPAEKKYGRVLEP